MAAVIPYQRRAWQRELHSQAKRFTIAVVHRRAGKTVAAVNELIRRILTCPLPNPRGAYICPEYAQAKRVAWVYLKEYLRPIPGVTFNESELCARIPGGAEIRLLGASAADSLRGIYLDYVVCDEVAQFPPRVWSEILRPCLADRKGGALMIGTPFGYNNLFYEFYRDAEGKPDWHRILLTVNDTDTIDAAELAALKRDMQPEEYEQEMLCSWTAAIRGAYYGKAMSELESSGRIGKVSYNPDCVVHTSWDLGMADTLVIWFWQIVGTEIHAIDLISAQSTGLAEAVRMVQAKGYVYGSHVLPHDVKVRELGTGKSRLEVLQSLGLNVTVARNLSVQDGISATRQMLPRCWFDRERCDIGIEGLKLYRTEWNDERRVFNQTPLHDWCSHYADAARYFAIMREQLPDQHGWSTPDYSHLNRAAI